MVEMKHNDHYQELVAYVEGALLENHLVGMAQQVHQLQGYHHLPIKIQAFIVQYSML